MRSSLLRLLVHKALGALVGKLFKSPLEQDFGEASEDDITVPEAVKHSVSPVEDLAAPMANLFASLDGLSSGKYEKFHTRMWELPVHRSARFQYQVRVRRDAEPTELQVSIQKHPGNVVQVEFRSNAEVIRLIESTVPTVAPPQEG